MISTACLSSRKTTLTNLQYKHSQRRSAAQCYQVDEETPAAEREALSRDRLAEEAAPDQCSDADRVRGCGRDYGERNDGVEADDRTKVDERESAGEGDRDPDCAAWNLVVMYLIGGCQRGSGAFSKRQS